MQVEQHGDVILALGEPSIYGFPYPMEVRPSRRAPNCNPVEVARGPLTSREGRDPILVPRAALRDLRSA